ncbi:restriction endonuclease subunit S [Mannheimia haemolytica]
MAFNQYVFSDIVELISEKIKIKDLKKENYISTDNMLPNFGGITLAENLPNSASCNRFAKKDILFSNIRTYFKKVWLAEFSGGCSPDVLVMRSKNTDILLNEYLFLLIRSDDFINFTVISANGAKMPRGDKNAMKGFIFNIPSIEYQKKCIANYFAFDQKIQLNTQTNQTLEAIAQAIFKSWFVDFDPVRAKAAALSEGKSEHEANLAAVSVICGKDTSELNGTEYKALWQIAEAFPSELVENEQFGEVPKGWEIVPLSTFGEIICGKTPTKTKAEYYGNDIPFIKIPDMHGKVLITQTIDNLSLIGANSQAKKYISKGSICVSCIATVGLVSLASRKSQTNQQINSIVPNNLNFSEYLYLYLSQSEMNKYMKNLASGGSATLNMNTSTFSSIEILKPNNEILHLFHKKSLDIFEKILKNEENNQILAQTRDLLLPKLLNGEI